MHIGGVSFVLAVIMVFASLSSIILGRLLTKNDFGEFTLMRTLILFIPPLAVWGQDLATARFFSRNDPRNYKWSTAFVNVMAGAVLLILLGSIVSYFVYNLSIVKLTGLVLAAVFYSAILFFSNLLRSQGRYSQAIIILNGFRGLFFLVLVVAYLTLAIDKTSAIAGYIFIIFLVSVSAGVYTFRTLPQGQENVPSEYYKSGLVLFASQAAVTIMTSFDRLIIPNFLGYEALGLYAACLVPVQAFNILGRASKYVWVPEFGRQQKIRFKRIVAGLALVTFLLLLVFLFGAKFILHILYAGKYDYGAYLLQLLALVGALRLMYNLSASLTVGRLDRFALNWHTRINVISMLFYIGLLYVMVKNLGVTGAALSLLIMTLLRMIASYTLVYRYRGQLKV